MKTVSNDVAYNVFEEMVSKRVAQINGPLFETTADPDALWDAYLENLTQHYNCHACKKFIQKYFGLAQVTPDGGLWPAILDNMASVPEMFWSSANTMRSFVLHSKITGVFVSSDKVWGTPKTGDWTHLSGVPSNVHKGLKTASQVAAEKKEDYGVLHRSLSEYTVEVIREAVRVLEADALDRSEKTLGVAKWFLDLHERAKGWRRNLVWLAVATAPPGWCHIRSSMISTLLDDIVAGMDFATISARWNAKIHPLQYMRPQAPPTAGSITVANKLVAKLSAEGSLSRRFAELDEIVTFWRPTASDPAKTPTGGGVFDHLKATKQPVALQLPAQTMTWVRFQETVLPRANKIELRVPSSGPFYGMVTAAVGSAPPILQWDTEPRNPFSWFFFHGGSQASRWSLTSGSWVTVNALCSKPPHWHHPEVFTREEEAVFMVLEGCRLDQPFAGGNFFPECLRSEFHEIRSVMEAYSNKAVVAGTGTANGLSLSKSPTCVYYIRVNGSDLYTLDRWH